MATEILASEARALRCCRPVTVRVYLALARYADRGWVAGSARDILSCIRGVVGPVRELGRPLSLPELHDEVGRLVDAGVLADQSEGNTLNLCLLPRMPAVLGGGGAW